MKSGPDKIHLFTAVWGAQYINEFIETSLCSILAENNIPSFSKKHKLVYDIFLRDEDRLMLDSSKQITELSKYATVNFQSLPKNVEDKYLLNYECQKQLIENPENSKSAFIWVCSDNIFTDGFFMELEDYISRGKRVVLTLGLALSDKTVNQFKTSFKNKIKTPLLASSVIDSLKQHGSHFLELYDANKKMFPTCVSFAYFGGSKKTSFLRAFHLHPAYFWPENNIKLFPWLDEGVYLSKSCPDKSKWSTMRDYSRAILFSGDKDEALYSPNLIKDFFSVVCFFSQDCCPSFLRASRQKMFLFGLNHRRSLTEKLQVFKFDLYFNLAIKLTRLVRFIPKRIFYKKVRGRHWKKFQKEIEFYRNGASYFDFYMRRLFLEKSQGIVIEELLLDDVYKESLCKKNVYNLLIWSFDHATDSYMRVFDLLLGIIENSSRRVKKYNYTKLKKYNRCDILSYLKQKEESAMGEKLVLNRI